MKKSTQIKYEIEIKKKYEFTEDQIIKILQRYCERDNNEDNAFDYLDSFNEFVMDIFDGLYFNTSDEVIFDDLDKNDQIEFKEIVKKYTHFFPLRVIKLMKEDKI